MNGDGFEHNTRDVRRRRFIVRTADLSALVTFTKNLLLCSIS
jgi:hypothetical protein